MSRYEFYLFQRDANVELDTSINIPAQMLSAIKFDMHFVLAVGKGDRADKRTYIRNEDDLLGFEDAESKALAWGEKPAASGWRFVLKSKDPQATVVTEIEEADIAVVDFSTSRVIAENASGDTRVIDSLDDVRSFWGEEPVALEPVEVDAVARAIDPSHYKGYIEEMQWIDAMSKIPSLRKPERFIAALELQIRKYMDRNGAKDLTIQEWKKARFYLVYLVAYIDNGHVCVPVTTIQERIKGL